MASQCPVPKGVTITEVADLRARLSLCEASGESSSSSSSSSMASMAPSTTLEGNARAALLRSQVANTVSSPPPRAGIFGVGGTEFLPHEAWDATAAVGGGGQKKPRPGVGWWIEDEDYSPDFQRAPSSTNALPHEAWRTPQSTNALPHEAWRGTDNRIGRARVRV